jgi:hypothetical protein
VARIADSAVPRRGPEWSGPKRGALGLWATAGGKHGLIHVDVVPLPFPDGETLQLAAALGIPFAPVYRVQVNFQDWPAYADYRGEWIATFHLPATAGGWWEVWPEDDEGQPINLQIWRRRVWLDGSPIFCDLEWHGGQPRFSVCGFDPRATRIEAFTPLLRAARFLQGLKIDRRGRKAGKRLEPYERVQASYWKWVQDPDHGRPDHCKDKPRPSQGDIGARLSMSEATVQRICEDDLRGWPPPEPVA